MKSARFIPPGTFHAALIFVICRTFHSRGGGTRTHTPSQDPDFKSENPRPGASYYVLVCSVGMPKTRLLWSEVSFCVQLRSNVYCCRIAAPINRGYHTLLLLT